MPSIRPHPNNGDKSNGNVSDPQPIINVRIKTINTTKTHLTNRRIKTRT
jgi:hypothetical protein